METTIWWRQQLGGDNILLSSALLCSPLLSSPLLSSPLFRLLRFLASRSYLGAPRLGDFGSTSWASLGSWGSWLHAHSQGPHALAILAVPVKIGQGGGPWVWACSQEPREPQEPKGAQEASQNRQEVEFWPIMPKSLYICLVFFLKKIKVVLCCFFGVLYWSSWQWASKKSSPTSQTCSGGSPGLVKGPYIGRFSRDNLNFEKKLKIQNNFKLPLKWKTSQVM